MTNTEKFTGKAKAYARFRPDYPKALIDDLVADHQLTYDSVVADIGSGTGIFTNQLLARNLRVMAVEPNKDMRTVMEAELRNQPGFTSVQGSAEQTTLADASVDLITVAQAFHWFDPLSFKKECRRILKPNRKAVLIWNSRVPNAPLIKESKTICQNLCPNFHGFSGGIDANSSSFDIFFRNGDYSLKTYDHPLRYTLEAFVGRHLSASYAPKANESNYEPYIEALTELFQKYSMNSYVMFPNETRSYVGLV